MSTAPPNPSGDADEGLETASSRRNQGVRRRLLSGCGVPRRVLGKSDVPASCCGRVLPAGVTLRQEALAKGLALHGLLVPVWSAGTAVGDFRPCEGIVSGLNAPSLCLCRQLSRRFCTSP